MAEQQSPYYPRGEGIYGRPPTLCIKCGHGEFQTVNPQAEKS